jgi:glycosyltransferase involved in cell wall biosynthesis
MSIEEKKIVFWGCGDIGKRFFDYCSPYFCLPDYYCDSNSKLWGKTYNGIEIVRPDKLANDWIRYVFITTVAESEVRGRLKELGIHEEKILTIYDIAKASVLNDIAKRIKVVESKEKNYQKKVFVDLSCGMVLGGVERWSYHIAKKINEIGIVGEYLVPYSRERSVVDSSLPVYTLGQEEKNTQLDILNAAIQRFNEYDTSYVICNFPLEIFQAACIVKKITCKKIKIVAVVHNDEELYYEVYGAWRDYVDLFLVISSKIFNKLIEIGIPEDKIQKLYWNMEYPKMEHIYSGYDRVIRIGYAGRVTIEQKRLDLFIAVALKLRSENVDFFMQIAGDGDYLKDLQQKILIEELDRNIQLIGYIPHDEIFEFWNNQDIYLSCSEYEGHSISQTEAMAMGVVPVVTRTSGTEDDIVDGYNGYIVDIGDIQELTECIIFLSRNPKKIEELGKNASKTISNKNNPGSEKKFWKDIFENV